MALINDITLTDGTFCEQLVDIDINGSSMYVSYTQHLVALDDASAFTVGGDIAGDGVGGNDGVGVVREVLTGNILAVDVTSGTFVAGNDVDNANPYAASDATIASVTNSFNVKRVQFESGVQAGTYL